MPSPMSRNSNASSPIDSRSGFCPKTKIYQCLRSPAPLPQATTPLSVTNYVFSLINSFPLPPTILALLDDITCNRNISKATEEGNF
ncbi:unnamed protein product [Linum trigynum]|uniref:Uncharacterized protein n=1 Tax=Linum trigynum TaxID=586398 RepID=A0AAV2CJJ4_9ROSI